MGNVVNLRCETELISELSQTSPRVGVILGTSGDNGAEQAALDAGADGFLPKPVQSLAAFQELILAQLPADRQPPAPRIVSDDQISPDPLAYRDDMAHVADVLGEMRDTQTLDYLAQFVSGVARSADDQALAAAAEALASARSEGREGRSDMARLAGLVQERLSQQIAI